MSIDIKTISIGGKKTIRVAVQSEHDIRSILFLGLGQTGKNLKWVAQDAPEGMVIVEAIPFLSTSGSKKMEAMGIHVVHTVLEYLQPSNDSYDLLAESQAAPVIVHGLLADKGLPKPHRVLLLQPLGLNFNALGATTRERYRSIMSRSLTFWRHPHRSLAQASNRETFYQITADSMRYFWRVGAAYKFGASQNISCEVRELTKGVSVHVFAGDNDPLFPFDEIKDTLTGSDVALHRLRETTHLNRSTKEGIRQLHDIYTSVTD